MTCMGIPSFAAPMNWDTMMGKLMMDPAKITGMTEQVLSGIGNVERSSLPAIFLEFVTGISLDADTRITQALITPRNTMVIRQAFKMATAGIFPDTNMSLSANTSEGNEDRILAHSRMETPFPASSQSRKELIPISTMAPALQITDAAATVAGV